MQIKLTRTCERFPIHVCDDKITENDRYVDHKKKIGIHWAGPTFAGSISLFDTYYFSPSNVH